MLGSMWLRGRSCLAFLQVMRPQASAFSTKQRLLEVVTQREEDIESLKGNDDQQTQTITAVLSKMASQLLAWHPSGERRRLDNAPARTSVRPAAVRRAPRRSTHCTLSPYVSSASSLARWSVGVTDVEHFRTEEDVMRHISLSRGWGYKQTILVADGSLKQLHGWYLQSLAAYGCYTATELIRNMVEAHADGIDHVIGAVGPGSNLTASICLPTAQCAVPAGTA
jgi:hypothetical protein